MKKTVSVFCGSRSGNDPAFASEMNKLGSLLAEHDWRIVFGGLNRGLMKDLAGGALEKGGRMKAFVPSQLSGTKDNFCSDISLIRVKDKYERIHQMAKSHAFIVGPGAFATMNDAMNIIDQSYRAYCRNHLCRPVIFMNVHNVFDHLIDLGRDFINSGFVEDGAEGFIIRAKNAEEVMAVLQEAEDNGIVEKSNSNVIRSSGQMDYQ